MLAGNNHKYLEELCFLISGRGKRVWHTDCFIQWWVQRMGFVTFYTCSIWERTQQVGAVTVPNPTERRWFV